MFTKTLIAATFAGLVAAAPAPASIQPSTTQSFTLLAAEPGSEVQYATINANDQRFWIGKSPSSSCAPGLGCAPVTQTALTTSTPFNGFFAMDVEVPGGQSVYVSADGSLGYTIAHSGVVPIGGSSLGFGYEPAGAGQLLGNVTYNGGNFKACLEIGEENVYKIYAAKAPLFVRIGCIDVAVTTESYNGTASWQY